MDWDNKENESKNLWERNGRRGGLTGSQGTGHRTAAGRSRRSEYSSGRAAGERERSGEETGVPRAAGGSRYQEKQPGQARGKTLWDKKPWNKKTWNKGAGNGRPGNKKRDGGTDVVRLAFMGLGAVAVIAYIVVAVYFGGHFYSGAQIYGIDCSRMTPGQVKTEVEKKLGEYTLTVEQRNGRKDVITASQIGLQYQDDNSIESQLKSQRCYIWPAMMLLGKSGNLSVSTTYDRDGIDNVLRNMEGFLPGNIVAPQDAHRGDTETGYEVVPEVMGTTLDFTKTKEVIMEALDQGQTTVSLEEKGCYIDPLVYQDDPDLNAEVEELNSLLTANITYDFGDRQEVVNGSVIKNWIVQNEDGSYYIDDNKIWEYVSQLADKYDTFGRDREFYTSLGTTVSLSGGDYGWAMDQDATAQILSEAVKAGKTETITPEYVYTAMSRDENDIGGTYVEISISMQEMWCYQDGNLVVDTPVVTGNPNRGNATPAGGVWAIDAKMQEYVLTGEGYEAPVDYWMPFNGDIGIHDMQNRWAFGGTIYLSNGSHGCVNTPYEAAQTIYNIVSIGTPVVVYD